jgi:hypothetical protein
VSSLSLPERFLGLAAFCAGWLVLYPVSREYAGNQAWWHWAGGGIVVVVWLIVLSVG